MLRARMGWAGVAPGRVWGAPSTVPASTAAVASPSWTASPAVQAWSMAAMLPEVALLGRVAAAGTDGSRHAEAGGAAAAVERMQQVLSPLPQAEYALTARILATGVWESTAVAQPMGLDAALPPAPPPAAGDPSPTTWLASEVQLAATRAGWHRPVRTSHAGSDALRTAEAPALLPATAGVTGAYVRAAGLSSDAVAAATATARRAADAATRASERTHAAAILSHMVTGLTHLRWLSLHALVVGWGGSPSTSTTAPESTPRGYASAVGAIVQASEAYQSLLEAWASVPPTPGGHGVDGGDWVRVTAALQAAAHLAHAATLRHAAACCLLRVHAAGSAGVTAGGDDACAAWLTLGSEYAAASTAAVDAVATKWATLVPSPQSPPPVATLMAGVGADVATAHACSLGHMAELTLLSGLHAIANPPATSQVVRDSAPSSGTAAGDGAPPWASTTPIFPLPAVDAKLAEPVIGKASQFALTSLKRLDAMAERGDGPAWLDAGRPWAPLSYLPLRTLATLQFMTQRAVMAEGLLQGGQSAMEGLTWRGTGDKVCQPGRHSPGATLDHRFDGAPLPLYAAAASVSHVSGYLWRQWDKREEGGMAAIAAGEAMRSTLARTLGVGHPSPARTPLQHFVQGLALPAAVSMASAGSSGCVLPAHAMTLLALLSK